MMETGIPVAGSVIKRDGVLTPDQTDGSPRVKEHKSNAKTHIVFRSISQTTDHPSLALWAAFNSTSRWVGPPDAPDATTQRQITISAADKLRSGVAVSGFLSLVHMPSTNIIRNNLKQEADATASISRLNKGPLSLQSTNFHPGCSRRLNRRHTPTRRSGIGDEGCASVSQALLSVGTRALLALCDRVPGDG